MPKRRRAYPFPKPQLVASKKSRSFDDRLFRWMTRSAYRMLHARQRAFQPLPDQQEIAVWMHELALQHGSDYFVSEYDAEGVPDKYVLTFEHVEIQARKAAERVVLSFDVDYIATRVAWGHDTHRGPTYALDILDSVPGLSITEQAAALGISVSTVSRRRRQALAAAKLPPIVTGNPETDALLAEVD